MNTCVVVLQSDEEIRSPGQQIGRRGCPFSFSRIPFDLSPHPPSRRAFMHDRLSFHALHQKPGRGLNDRNKGEMKTESGRPTSLPSARPAVSLVSLAPWPDERPFLSPAQVPLRLLQSSRLRETSRAQSNR